MTDTSRKCSLCDDTGAKDYAGFAMDSCDHSQPDGSDTARNGNDWWDAVTTGDERERLWASLHNLICNPSIEEIPLVMEEVVSLLRGGRAPVSWRPITSAPNDGTDILAIWIWQNDDGETCGTGTHDVVRQRNGFWYDQTGRGAAMPSHWMPLPAAPAQGAA